MRAKIDVWLILQLSAVAASTANSTARWFNTGNGPGNPRHIGQTLLLGGSPNWVEQPQKILVRVRSWTWTSNPMTGSYLDCAATGASGVVAIDLIIVASAADQALRASFGTRWRCAAFFYACAMPPKDRTATACPPRVPATCREHRPTAMPSRRKRPPGHSDRKSV